MFQDNNCREIRTGVDKLLFLVNEHKEITLSEASQLLEISKDVLNHWSDALENQGLLKTKYTFNKKFLMSPKHAGNGNGSWSIKLNKLMQSLRKNAKNKNFYKHLNRLKIFCDKLEESDINPEIKNELKDILKKAEALV